MGWRPVCLIACHALLLYLASMIGHQLVVWAASLASLSTLNFDLFTKFMVRSVYLKLYNIQAQLCKQTEHPDRTALKEAF